MKKIILLILLIPGIILSQTYRDIYTNGINMISEDNPSHNVIWVSPTINTTVTFTLPPNFGQAGYAMTSLGDGSLTWTDVSSVLSGAAGSSGQIQFNNSGVFGASANLFWDSENGRLGIGTSSPQTSVHVNTSMGIGLNGNGGAISLYSEQGATDYEYYIKAPANLSNSITFTWPSNFTAADQILMTNGNGELAWSTSWAGTNGDCVGQGLEPNNTGTNDASGGDAFVGGGTGNEADGNNSFIGGGVDNSVSGDNSSVLSGRYNEVGDGADFSFIGGGQNNTLNGSYSVIFSGEDNSIGSQAISSGVGAGRNNTVNSSYSFIAGGENNTINVNSNYSFIGAGTGNSISSNAPHSGILAGDGNNIGSGASYSVIGAGLNNQITGNHSFIGSGTGNQITGNYSSIIAGENNTISGNYSFIAGGTTNTASGNYTMVIGRNATASGNYSVAMGRRSQATHNGSFVISDGNDNTLSSSVANQLSMRFTGEYSFFTNQNANVGARLNGGTSAWTTISDKNVKNNILELNPKIILEKLNKLQIFSWNYKGFDSGIRNYGPMAQEFFELFGNDGLGQIGTDKTVSSYDLSALGIIGIQTLKENLTNNKIKISELEYKNQVYKEKLEKLNQIKIKLENQIKESQSNKEDK